MSSTQPLPPKKEVALALLERSSVYVHLDPRQSAVVVPPWFKRQPQLVLQIGLNMPMPIPDLRLDDDGLSCTLSFNRSPFFCVVPWASVFAMVGEDGRGMVWPDDVPAEVARQAQVRAVDGSVRKDTPSKPGTDKETKADLPKAKRSRKRPPLAAVPDAAAADGPDEEGQAEAGDPARPNRQAEELGQGAGAQGRPRGGEGAPAAQGAQASQGKKAAKSRAPLNERGAHAHAGHGGQGGGAQGGSPRPVVAPTPVVRPASNGARKKRELPPYLRVVK
jgi:stringent starvation protein B